MSTVLTVILILVVLFVGVQLLMVFKMKAKKGSAAPELGGKVGKLLQDNGKTLLYFHSPGCRACKPMTPFIEKIAAQNKAMVMIDVAQDMSTAQKFGVMGTPSLVMVQNGKISEFLVGFQSEEKVRRLLN